MEDLELQGDRLEHFLLGMRLTYAPLMTPTELDTLLRGARALFGRHHHQEAEAAASFLQLWPEVMLRHSSSGTATQEERTALWPLLGALYDLKAATCTDEETGSSSSDIVTPPPTSALPKHLPKPLIFYPATANATPLTASPTDRQHWATDDEDEDEAYTSLPGRGRSLTLLSDFSSTCRLVTPASHGGRSVLLIDIGGRSVSVLPDGRVLLETGWGRAKAYDLTGKAADETRSSCYGLDPPSR